MPRELFVPKSFNTKSRRVIRQANAIIEEYRSQGFVLTLRQLYYQFVARGYIPNSMSEYKKLGSVVNDARLAGLIDWNMIEDRTRDLMAWPNWRDPADRIKTAADSFRLDIWRDQRYHIEVWIEKEALVGVVEPICAEFRMPYFACRGYTSQSEQWRAGKRLARYYNHGRKILVLHLGDHDPSGIDMTRDNRDRLRMFAGDPYDDDDFEIRRIALTMEQVELYGPPPNPAKMTDTRFAGYVSEFGDESWELDALDPRVIDDLIRSHVEPLIEWNDWNAALTEEAEARRIMTAAATRWPDVQEMLDRPDYA